MGNRLGVEKAAAARVGLRLEEYRRKVGVGLKWCTGCKDWHPQSAFRDDETRGDKLAAKCQESRRLVRAGRGRGSRKIEPEKERARGLINARVKRGTMSNPNDVPCADCGHLGPDRRHEYDHHLGYEDEQKDLVQCVCAKCHRRREALRNGQTV